MERLEAKHARHRLASGLVLWEDHRLPQSQGRLYASRMETRRPDRRLTGPLHA